MSLQPLPPTYAATRGELQRVATHVIARRRFAGCGKFGLRATPGGFGSPACGPDFETLRIAGSVLVRETTDSAAVTRSLRLDGASLADAAELAGVDLGEPFETGHDTPPLGNPAARLAIDDAAAVALAEWFRFGWEVLDAVLGELGSEAAPSVLQLWPEHFDAGVDVAATRERRVNLGASPGDASSAQPYLYVGPWDPGRPGDPAYWNAPFGAVLTYDDLRAVEDPAAEAVAFLLRGVEYLRAGAATPSALQPAAVS